MGRTLPDIARTVALKDNLKDATIRQVIESMLDAGYRRVSTPHILASLMGRHPGWSSRKTRRGRTLWTPKEAR